MPAPSVLLRALATHAGGAREELGPLFCQQFTTSAGTGGDVQINSKGPSRKHLGWRGNSRQAGGDLTNPVDQKQSRKAKRRMLGNNFVLIYLNFPLKQMNISCKDILMNIGS